MKRHQPGDRRDDGFLPCARQAPYPYEGMCGHVANRLQMALWREAIHLVTEGVVSVADADAAIAYGPGLRWALMGPHLTFHLGGGEGGINSFHGASRWRNPEPDGRSRHDAAHRAVRKMIIDGVAAEAGSRHRRSATLA